MVGQFHLHPRRGHSVWPDRLHQEQLDRHRYLVHGSINPKGRHKRMERTESCTEIHHHLWRPSERLATKLDKQPTPTVERFQRCTAKTPIRRAPDASWWKPRLSEHAHQRID